MRIPIHVRRFTGFTLVEIMIVIAIIGLLAAVAVPNYIAMITKAKRHACRANLEQIDGAKAMWSADQKKAETDVPREDDLKPMLKDNKLPVCPAGGTYTIGSAQAKATCSVHSSEASP